MSDAFLDVELVMFVFVFPAAMIVRRNSDKFVN